MLVLTITNVPKEQEIWLIWLAWQRPLHGNGKNALYREGGHWLLLDVDDEDYEGKSDGHSNWGSSVDGREGWERGRGAPAWWMAANRFNCDTAVGQKLSRRTLAAWETNWYENRSKLVDCRGPLQSLSIKTTCSWGKWYYVDGKVIRRSGGR